MAHKEQIDYCYLIKALFPKWFRKTRVLEIGSQDICGSIRPIFWQCEYTGIDLGPGKNVTAIGSGHNWPAPNGYYDTIACCEVAEHDRHYHETMKNIIRMLKPGGLLLFTCATTGRAEHGTTRTSSYASPYTTDYYQNVTEDMIRGERDFNKAWQYCRFTTDQNHHDLQLVAIKKGKHFTFSPSLFICIAIRFYAFFLMRVKDNINGVKKILKINS